MNIQSWLTMGAMVILSLAALNFNSAVLENSTIEIENKVALTAFSLADDLIEEIKGKAFDAATVQFPTTNPASLSPPGGLGPLNSEVYPNYNDIDDFHNFTKTVSAPHAENYTVTCKVQYVDGNDPDKIVNTQTFYKKVTVKVTSPYLRHHVTLSFIFTLK